jgi:hypothetical protein
MYYGDQCIVLLYTLDPGFSGPIHQKGSTHSRVLIHTRTNPNTQTYQFPATPSPAPGESAQEHHYRKHLEWIYPLAVRAVQVAGKERDDGQILQ